MTESKPWWRDRTILVVIVLMAAMLALCISIPILATRHEDDFADRCRAAGGVPFTPRSGRICLDPSAVIEP